MEIPVEKIAALSYLRLKENERDTYRTQLQSILQYVQTLEAVKMTPEEAATMGQYHVQTAFYNLRGLSMEANLRDENTPSEVDSLNLTNGEALRNAPASSGLPEALMYEVPSIIER